MQEKNVPALLFMRTCPESAGDCTKLRLTIWQELRIHDRMCLDWGYPNIRFTICHGHGGNQITLYDKEQMVSETPACVNFLAGTTCKQNIANSLNIEP